MVIATWNSQHLPLAALCYPYFGEATEICASVPSMRQEGAAGVVSGGDGAGGAVGRVVRVDRALLPKARQWVAPGGSGADAAHLLVAAVVQLSDPG